MQEDGTIGKIKQTLKGRKQLKYVDPYALNRAVTMVTMGGITCVPGDEESKETGCGNMVVSDIQTGDFVKVQGVDFGENQPANVRIIAKNDSGQRLDKFLTKSCPKLPKALMYKYIRTKKIKVNRARTEQSYMLAEGDEIQLFIRDEFFESPEKDTGALSRIVPKLCIVYEDENIVLLNKRPGVLVHEDADAKDNTLVMHLQAYLAQKGEYDPADEQSFAPAMCNRIDRNTGGIVIAAKNAAALREMNEHIREDRIGKYYLCAAHGVPAQKKQTLRGYLRKTAADNMVEVRD
jgi:23S rRNA pseudouridine955/2504/2580 synthase